MAVPSLPDAERLLASYGLPDGIVVHSRGVSRVAAEVARLLAAAGVAVDPQLVQVAALLHDIDKPETRDQDGQHGLVAARWLTEQGYAELAEPVASHPIGSLLDPDRAPRGWSSVSVAVADRHVAQGFLTIDERINDQIARYPAYRASLEAARGPAHAMEAELATAAGISGAELTDALRTAWEAAERGAA